MKILLSKRSVPKIALLLLLTLNLFAVMAPFVYAAPTGKSPNVLITGTGKIELTWKSGKLETYSISSYSTLGGLVSARLFPSRGWHIESLLADGNVVDFGDKDGNVAIDLREAAPKRSVSVTFALNGGVDDVDETHLVAYPDPIVGVAFTEVNEGGGLVYASTIGLEQLGQVGDSWSVWTDGYWFVGDVTVELVLKFSDLPEGVTASDLKLYQTELMLGDVDLNGVVDGTDVSIIANHNPSTQGEPNYDQRCDIALPKGIIDDNDVNMASHNIGLESVWIQLNTIFSIDADNELYIYRAVTTGSYLPIDPIFNIHEA